jgi:predicted  nucleic acid-binding Zn-ribbon protein
MSDCCPHTVERHAYNGCAECGCNVRWTEHPERDYDTSDAGLAANKAHRERLERRIDELSTLRAEHERLGERIEALARLVTEGQL